MVRALEAARVCELVSPPVLLMARLLAVLSMVIALASPLMAQQEEPAAPPAAIETATDASIDREIEIRIEGIFGEIDGLEKIRAGVNAGVVVLGGEVAEARYAKQAEALAARVKGVVAVSNEIAEQTDVGERLVPVLDRFGKRVSQAVNYLPLVGLAVLVGLAIALFGWLIASRQRPWSWLAPNAFIADLLRQLMVLAFSLLGIVVALDILGATAALGTILGAAGIFGLAIGFAVRDTVENYISTILLSIRQPFRPKDLVSIDGYEGHVIRLTSRATVLMDRDGNHVRIPNATVFKSNILNYSRNAERRFTFTLGVDADSDLFAALEICHNRLAAMPFVVDDPEPGAWIEEVGDSNVVIGIAGWIDQTKSDFVRSRSEAIRLVKEALEANGFALPEPIYRLRIDGSSPPLPGGDVKGDAVSKPASRPRREAKPAVSKTTNTDVDDAVLKKIEEERAEEGAGDLLSEDAADELDA